MLILSIYFFKLRILLQMARNQQRRKSITLEIIATRIVKAQLNPLIRMANMVEWCQLIISTRELVISDGLSIQFQLLYEI
jgi:hypothetical protein